MATASNLGRLLQGNPYLWRGRDIGAVAAWPSGHPELDALLPGGGWPIGALTELIAPCWGIGELRLLLPAMASMTRDSRWLVWISPPHLPYAPALAQAGVDLSRSLLIDAEGANVFWAMEQLLRHRDAGLVLAWPERPTTVAMRRLQLAAEAGKSVGVVLHHRLLPTTPAALRLHLRPDAGRLRIDILKSRGSLARHSVTLTL